MRSFPSLVLASFGLIFTINHARTDCLTSEIRESLTNKISNWYFAQIDGIKFEDNVKQFNPNIDDIFKCDCNKLDICIGEPNNNDCSLGQYDSCKELKDEHDGYWRQFKDILIGINFGQISFECDEKNKNIIARLTKSIFLKDGERFNDDLWEFDSDDHRAISWNIYAQNIN
mmetsp:Transcript_23221/g.20403  ORF Transcript_23221/g.20403 Transcript_23221/m.20403 type:complete len:172 (-) Transcript_23221:148-663(-)